MSEVLLRVKQVQQVTGLSRSAIYVEPALLASRVHISDRCVAWPRSIVDAWVAGKIAASAQQ
jgi:predicted DNA-binding transcriptional regulator AlpA